MEGEYTRDLHHNPIVHMRIFNAVSPVKWVFIPMVRRLF